MTINNGEQVIDLAKALGAMAKEADMVCVVRCKDCKWSDWYTSADGNRCCYCMETAMGGRTENDFCSYGERGDSDDD